jgi:hypothetical protein
MRNDNVSGFRGNSRGLLVSAGAAISLDWVSSRDSWNLYSNNGFKRFYLTVDYTRLSTFSGDVDFSINGIIAGLTFEY